MLCLLSPAKKLDFSNPSYSNVTLPRSLDHSQVLINHLKNLSPEQIAQLMHLSESLANLNHARYNEFTTNHSVANSKQALLTFAGDVYKGIEVSKYTPEDFIFAQKHLRILSGLYGLLRPLDLIQAYRLEMGTKLPVGAHNNLYQFWQSEMLNLLNADIKDNSSKLVLNLASSEYSKAIDIPSLSAPMVNVVFKHAHKSGYKTIGILAKRARGQMVNFIVKNKITQLSDVIRFDHDGYSYQENFSGDNNLVFYQN